MKDTKPRYIAYIRKSEERKERQELSHKAQIRKIKEQFSDLNIVEWLEPESQTAFTPGRPTFNRMMQMIADGKAEGIVSYHPNRLSRNEIDAATVTYALRSKLKDLKFCTYNFDNSPEGIMMLQFVMGQSQYESAKQGRDVSRGMEQKAIDGERPGQVPQGYIKQPILDKNGSFVMKKNKVATYTEKDPERWELVRKMWHMFLYEGYNPDQIWKKAVYEWGFTTRKTTEKTGGKPIPRRMVYDIFTKAFYAGYLPHNGELYKGSHFDKAMITLEEFDYAQTLLGAKGRPRSAKGNVAYGSMIRCGVCDCQVVTKPRTKLIKSTNEIKTYVYYYCSRKSLYRPCDQKNYTSIEKLESDIDAELAKYEIIPEFRDLALKVLRENHKQEVSDRTNIYEAQQTQRKRIQQQLDSLTDKLTRGVVDEDDYVRQRDTLKSQLSDLDGGLRNTEKRAEDWLALTERAFDFATYARVRFHETKDPAVKSDILRTLGVNFILKDNKLTLTPNKWLLPIERDYKQLEKAYLKVRTNKKATAKELADALESIFDIWRAIVRTITTEVQGSGNLFVTTIKPF